MGFCSKGMYNSFVTAMTPSWMVGQFKHWLGIISDDEYAKWLNEPDQKKLWSNIKKSDIANHGPSVPNEQPRRAGAPLVYDPAVAELPPELMFMHDAVMQEGEQVADIELKFPEYRENWWEETEADRNIASRGSMKSRVQDYLDNSEKVEYEIQRY